MSREFRTDWSEEKIQQLKDLWAEGVSCSGIARTMGEGLTRCAVIGKVHRLGLPSRLSTRAHSATRPAPKAKPSRPRAIFALSTEPALPPAILETGLYATVETIGARMCRWPIGDPQEESFHFCGNDALTSAPYCIAHCREAYQPMHVRQAEGAQSERQPQRRGQTAMFD